MQDAMHTDIETEINSNQIIIIRPTKSFNILSDLEIFAVGAEVDGNEGQPNDAGRIHRERDVLGLVEVLRDVAGLDLATTAANILEHCCRLENKISKL